MGKCGAKTRKTGVPCKGVAMENGRCLSHGGKATGPIEPNPVVGADNPQSKYGVYAKYYDDDDKAFLDEVRLGQVDDELRFMRMRLNRTIRARSSWEQSLKDGTGKVLDQEEGGDPHRVLVEIVDDEGITKDGDILPVKKKVFRLPDFDAIEQRCLARIESLEKTRKELLASELPDPEQPGTPGGGHSVAFSGGLGGTDGPLPNPFKKTP